MKIQKSAEDYLETILILYNRRGTVHAIDIANELAFSKPSVSVAMKIAVEDACRMEHVISAESFAAIKNHVQKSFQKSTSET